MGALLDQGPGTVRLEVAGRVEPLRAEGAAAPGDRVGFHEPNSPGLLRRLAGVLDRGAIPVLAHPRWPTDLAAQSMMRAGAGTSWAGAPLATLLFTSGSTAAPKVVAHTLSAHLAAARASAQRIPFGAEHRWLLTLPLCHVGGLALLFRAVVGGGATLVFPEPGERLPAALVRTRPSHVSLVATQLRDVLEDAAATAALADCDVVLLGGGPAPESVVRRARDCGVALRRTYGMTEMGSQIATETGGRVLPLEDVELRLNDAGELLVRGPSLFAGYLRDGTLDDALVDGYFPTGDLARFDADGGLEIVGRRDNQFISGGENVQPEAVEARLAEFGVEAVVVSVPDSRYGARPVAFTAHGTAYDDIAATALPSFARPVAWLELPASTGLKPRRGELAELAARVGRFGDQ